MVSDNDTLSQSNSSLTSIINSLVTQITSLETQITSLDTQTTSLETQITSLQTQINDINTELGLLSQESQNNTGSQSTDVIYLDSNGVTIKAYDSAGIGATGVINGVEYTVVSNTMIRDWIIDERDLSKVVTTKVTSLGDLFYDAESSGMDIESLNPDVSSWDTSNIINMNYLFDKLPSFNGDISSWDVSNVETMEGMFSGSSFNGDISSWDVSNVEIMETMFTESSFNGDISSWDVSSVRIMYAMFANNSSFNQNLGSWSVTNVIDCNFFSLGASNWSLPKPNFTNCSE